MTGATQRPRLFTLGHGDHSLERFLSILSASSIRVLADVRSNPASPRFPWFERAALASELESRGLSYRWFRELGGRRPHDPDEVRHPALPHEWQRNYAAAMNRPDFHFACADLIGLSASAQVAVMCAEKKSANCHRFLLADKLMLMGARVTHILGPDDVIDHVFSPDLEFIPSMDDPSSRLLYSGRQLTIL